MTMLEHPEIAWIERTGYPSWLQERPYPAGEDGDHDGPQENERRMMMNQVCRQCGRRFRPDRADQLYCSRGCRIQYCNSRRPAQVLVPCLYNRGVDCQIRDCRSCGWNPAVAEKRLARIRERLEAEYEAKRRDQNELEK